jgi:hypothetical protein
MNKEDEIHFDTDADAIGMIYTLAWEIEKLKERVRELECQVKKKWYKK